MDKLEDAIKAMVLIGTNLDGYQNAKEAVRAMLTPLSDEEIEKLKKSAKPLPKSHNHSLIMGADPYDFLGAGYNQAISDIAKDYWLVRK